jgi:hypothetical protein
MRRFESGLDVMRRGALEAAGAALALDRCGHFLYEKCASMGELGELHGASADETRRLVDLGKALEESPPLESRILCGRVSLHAASLVGQMLGDRSMLRPGDAWLLWAETEDARTLRRRIDRRREEVRLGEVPAVALTVFVSPRGRDDFARARTLASRKARRRLTEGETLEAVADHYLASFDPSRRRPGTRRSPHTSMVPGRYVPASVRRTLGERNGDRCAIPLCGHEVFLENAHVVPHAHGGDREAENLVRLCRRHHRMFDEGSLRMLGPPDRPRFVACDGRDLGVRQGAGPPEAPATPT